ncbi:MAG: hypothetical protein LBK22_02790 [Tannerella sp.]|jgi:hypothetical protein|nr:hypothetical protein [Tannerella sp.]
MPLNCSNLTQNLIAAICGQTAAAGLEDDIILLDFNDVDKGSSTLSDSVIEEIVMNTGKKGFIFTSYGKSFNDSGATFTKGTYRNTWLHNVMLRIFTKSETSKSFVNALGEGAKLIAIVKNREAGPNGHVKYEAYGWDNGLVLNEGTASVNMDDGIVYTLNIGSEDTAQEGSLPKSVFDTDLATTELMLASLTAA